MKIAPITARVAVQGSRSSCSEKPKQKCWHAALPNAEDYDYIPLYTSPDAGDRLQSEYTQKLNRICFDSEGNLHPAIKNMLDNSRFIFEIEEGNPQCISVKEAISKCIDGEENISGNLYHATDTMENARNIVRTGFNPECIRRTEFGPGFYFAPTEGDARDYGGAVLIAKCKGRAARISDKYYSKIANNAVTNAVRDFVGLKSKGYPTSSIEYDTAKHVVNEYVRGLLVNDLGYDVTCASGRGKSCVVVHNPDTIQDIKILNRNFVVK